MTRPLPFLLTAVCLLGQICTPVSRAQQFSLPHGLYTEPVTLTLTSSSQREMRYTLDGSTPTMASPVYREPLTLSQTTVVRAAEVQADTICRPVATATYVFPLSVIGQAARHEGYPDRWGRYVQISGTAKADYEMDPELTADATYREQITVALHQLPLLSLVTDRECLFGLEEDPERGGIYIYTGAPVGSGVGRDWERPVSAELMGGPQAHDLTIDCALKMHGGHSRLPEKNPKHSLRLTFKSQYGPAKLHYPLYGDRGVQTFNALVVRTFFGNAWQHWKRDSRGRAQYTRDLWARHMQRLMGHPYADGLYVHLFINGLYWGLYNITERVSDDYCKEHFGGKKTDYDVIKVEEQGGQHTVTAADGTMDKWEEMLALVTQAATSRQAYLRLQGLNTQGERDASVEPLLDIDAFIDYMLINHYGGNNDWDSHNWYAFRNRASADHGFQFICWDTESIFEQLTDNILSLNNAGCPTGIFQQLMHNQQFQDRYMDRAHQLLAPGGLLSPESAVALWDSLYHTIAASLYAESARWGDYRRDVHPYSSRGQLFTVGDHYQTERQRLLTQYFPYRSQRLLDDLILMGWYSSGIAQTHQGEQPHTYYDLQGRRLASPPTRRGLYIVNGRKHLVRSQDSTVR